MAIFLVASGGALGAVTRLLVGDAVARRLGTGWPYGTLVINVSGCFLIALFLGAAASRTGLSIGFRYFIPVGFIGGYTTFSTFAWEASHLIELGQVAGAAAYVGASNALGFGAVVLGGWLGRKI
jgi:CrcB protein